TARRPRPVPPPLIRSSAGQASGGPAPGPPQGRGVSPRPASRCGRGRGGAGRGRGRGGRGPAPTGCRAPGRQGSVRGGGGGAGSWLCAVLLDPPHRRSGELTTGGRGAGAGPADSEPELLSWALLPPVPEPGHGGQHASVRRLRTP
ncbi:hypothetical protein MC885_018245, partial [Smutsia gigantea]